MRRVNILVGIQQRLNEFLGTASVGSGELTAWSIQAAMLNNFKKLFTAMSTGNDYGRILSGLSVSKDDNDHISITSGYGVTAAGNMVKFPGTTNHSTDMASDATTYVCLSYILGEMYDEPGNGGMKTAVINQSGEHQIVFDELGNSGTPADDIISGMLSIDTGIPNAGSDKVLLATLVTSSGTLSVTKKSPLFASI